MYIAYFHVLFLLVAMFSDNHKRSIIVPNRMGSSIIQFQHVNLRAVTHKIPSPMFKRILACLAKSPKKVPSTIILMQWGRRWEFRVLSNRRGTKFYKKCTFCRNLQILIILAQRKLFFLFCLTWLQNQITPLLPQQFGTGFSLRVNSFGDLQPLGLVNLIGNGHGQRANQKNN